MPKPEHVNESAKTGKAGKVLPTAGAAVKREQGSQAHEEDGSQVDIWTAKGVANLLKSDLTEAVSDPEPEEQQTPAGKGDEQTNEDGTSNIEQTEEEKRKAEAHAKAAKAAKDQNAEALKEVEAWNRVIADLESQLAEAADDKKAEIQKQIEEGKQQIEVWEKLAEEPAEAGTPNAEVPEALQNAITEWETAGGGELPPALQTLVEKSIHRVTRQRELEKTRADQAEAKVQELATQLESARSATGPVAGPMLDPKRLDLLERSGKQAINELDAALEGIATEEEAKRVADLVGSERLDTPEARVAMKRKMRELQEALSGIPAERQRVQAFRSEEAKVAPLAKEWFPFLYDQSHADYQEAQQVLAVMPDLAQRTPNHQIALGTYILGLRELKRLHPEVFGGQPTGASAAARGARALPRKAPKKSPVSGGGAAAPNGARTKARDAEETAARQRFEKSPTKESVKELLKVSLRS